MMSVQTRWITCDAVVVVNHASKNHDDPIFNCICNNDLFHPGWDWEKVVGTQVILLPIIRFFKFFCIMSIYYKPFEVQYTDFLKKNVVAHIWAERA